MKIKICGLTRKQDIEYCIKNGINYIGFIFYKKSKRYVTPKKILQVLSSINKKSTKTVGVFVNESIKTVVELSNMLKLDYVQLHGNETPEYCLELYKKGIQLIKAFRLKTQKKNEIYNLTVSYFKQTEYFLFDTYNKDKYGGTGIKFNWNLLKNIDLNKQYFLSGGITVKNIAEAAELLKPYCIDISSGVEISEGIKDKTKIKRIAEIKQKTDGD